MTNLKEMTLSLVAAKNARDDARFPWQEVLQSGGETHQEAMERARVAQAKLERLTGAFRELLDELTQAKLLPLSINALDRESLTAFRAIVAALQLDEYTQPLVCSSFNHIAASWRRARRFLHAAEELQSRARSIEPDELVAEMQQLDSDEPEEEEYGEALNGWRHLYELSSSDDTNERSLDAAAALVRYGRAQLEELVAALALKVASMSAGDLRGALASLEADLGLELKRALESGLVRCPRAALADEELEPEPPRQTEVGTLVREDEEVAEDVELSPEQEALVDELLKDAFDDHSSN
ncbi:MAG TPA: hypothetical protein V6C81_12615 [Planktothrix sp.]|jgi:hypothetical protein